MLLSSKGDFVPMIFSVCSSDRASGLTDLIYWIERNFLLSTKFFSSKLKISYLLIRNMVNLGKKIFINWFFFRFTSSASHTHISLTLILFSEHFQMKCVFGQIEVKKKNGGLIPMIKSQSSLKYLKIMCKLNSTSGKTKSDPFSCWHGSFFRTLLLFAFFSAMREMVLKSIRLNTQWRDLNFCISAPKWACFTEMAWPDPVQKAIQLN